MPSSSTPAEVGLVSREMEVQTPQASPLVNADATMPASRSPVALTKTPGGSILAATLTACLFTACSPALDWRDVRLPGAEVMLLFPCKPVVQERSLDLGGTAWGGRLQACDAGDLTFVALTLSPPDTAAYGPGTPLPLSELLQTAPARWGTAQADAQAPAGVQLPGGLRGTWTRHIRNASDGRTLHTQAFTFASNGHMVQLSVHGARLGEAALESFYGQLRVAP